MSVSVYERACVSVGLEDRTKELVQSTLVLVRTTNVLLQ